MFPCPSSQSLTHIPYQGLLQLQGFAMCCACRGQGSPPVPSAVGGGPNRIQRQHVRQAGLQPVISAPLIWTIIPFPANLYRSGHHRFLSLFLDLHSDPWLFVSPMLIPCCLYRSFGIYPPRWWWASLSCFLPLMLSILDLFFFCINFRIYFLSSFIRILTWLYSPRFSI